MINELENKFNNRLTTIGKISDVICGPFGSAIKNTDYQGTGIPLIRIGNISRDGYMDYTDTVFILEKLGNKYARTQVSPGDIVISQRGSLGQCAIVDNTYDKLNISANIIAIKNITGYSSEFVRDYLLSNIGQSLLERNVSGQVQPKITTQDISDIVIPLECNEKALVPLIQRGHFIKEQKTIKANELLSNQSNTLLHHLNIKIGEFTSSLCSAVSLTSVLHDKTLNADYYHPERLNAINSMKNNPLFCLSRLIDVVDFCRSIVNSSDVTERYLGLSGVESQTGELTGIEEDASGQAYSYQSNDVLYGRLRPYLNKVLFAEQSGICSTEFHVMRVKNKKELLPEFLAEIMRSDLILSQTKHMMTGNTHPRISNDDVKNLFVPIPDISLQQQIINDIRNRKMEARRLKQEAEQKWKTAKEQFEKELLGESFRSN